MHSPLNEEEMVSNALNAYSGRIQISLKSVSRLLCLEPINVVLLYRYVLSMMMMMFIFADFQEVTSRRFASDL